VKQPLSATIKKNSWLRLFVGDMLLIGFMFGIGPAISKRIQPAYYKTLRASGIRANGLFYTDIKLSADAEQYVSDSLRFSPTYRNQQKIE
jgi:hypothetical protein